MRLRLTTIGMLAAAAVATAVPAFAQLPPVRAARPAKTVFGAGLKPASERLTIGASFGAGYDDDLTVVPPGFATPVHSGEFASAITNLRYMIDRDTLRGGLSLGAAIRYYGQNQAPIGIYNGGGDVTYALSKKTSMTANFRAGSYLNTASIFTGDAFSVDPFQSNVPFVPIDTAFPDGSTYNSLYADVGLGHQFSTRVSASGSYTYYANNAWSGTATTTYGAHSGRGGVTVDLGKGFSARAGYAYTGGGLGLINGVTPAYSGHSFDGGVSYSNAISLSRRSSLSFSTSMTTISDQNANTRFFAGGTVTYTYEIGRSWDTGVHYSRGVDMYQILGQPTFSDQVDFNIGGGIGRRVQVAGGAGYIRGTVGVSAGAPPYDATHGGAGVRIGLARNFGLSINYAYYRYEYDSSIPLPPGLLSSMERQVFRISFDVWAPLYERARRANATR